VFQQMWAGPGEVEFTAPTNLGASGSRSRRVRWYWFYLYHVLPAATATFAGAEIRSECPRTTHCSEVKNFRPRASTMQEHPLRSRSYANVVFPPTAGPGAGTKRWILCNCGSRNRVFTEA
jgi:hypothetical protein